MSTQNEHSRQRTVAVPTDVDMWKCYYRYARGRNGTHAMAIMCDVAEHVTGDVLLALFHVTGRWSLPDTYQWLLTRLVLLLHVALSAAELSYP